MQHCTGVKGCQEQYTQDLKKIQMNFDFVPSKGFLFFVVVVVVFLNVLSCQEFQPHT